MVIELCRPPLINTTMPSGPASFMIGYARGARWFGAYCIVIDDLGMKAMLFGLPSDGELTRKAIGKRYLRKMRIEQPNS
jgi:hypothetical protein